MNPIHKIKAILIHAKAMNVCKDMDIPSKIIISSQLACVIQQIIDDKKINHLIPLQTMTDKQEQQFSNLVDNIEELCSEYISELIKTH